MLFVFYNLKFSFTYRKHYCIYSHFNSRLSKIRNSTQRLLVFECRKATHVWVGCRKSDIRLSACSNRIQFDSFLSWVESKISRLNSTNAHHWFKELNTSNYVPTKHHLREVLILFFNLKKSATESHRMLLEAYGDYTPSINTREYWFRCFKSRDFDTEDKECPGHSKKIEDEELETLIDKDPC